MPPNGEIVATSKDSRGTAKPVSSGKSEPRAATKTSGKADSKTYGEQAAALAADTRDLAENITGELDKLASRIDDINETEPTADEAPAADGIRRIPMAIDEAKRAMHALVVAAADLTRQAGQ